MCRIYPAAASRYVRLCSRFGVAVGQRVYYVGDPPVTGGMGDVHYDRRTPSLPGLDAHRPSPTSDRTSFREARHAHPR
jgi:hypothetical protein